MKKKILVCGATGFIGRNMAEAFTQDNDFEVYGVYFRSSPLHNPKIRMVKADLTDKDDVERLTKGMDIVLQYAATTSGSKDSFNKPYYHVTDNAVMNALIFRAAYDNGVSHVIFPSCTTIYQSGDHPVKETDFDANKEIYPAYFGGAWTKVYNEKMCEFYSRIGSGKFTVIRQSNIYGPYDKFDLERSHVFGATVTKVMSAKDAGTILVWGTGEEERDLLYISDLVNFVRLAIIGQKSKFEIFNCGCGSAISIKDLVYKIVNISGKEINIEFDLAKPSIKTKICLDTTKAKKMLGWYPKVSLEEGIQKTFQWYRQNIK